MTNRDSYPLGRRVATRANYKTYTRKGRPDQIAQVRLEDLKKISTSRKRVFGVL